jgi:hypothetical protein
MPDLESILRAGAKIVVRAAAIQRGQRDLAPPKKWGEMHPPKSVQRLILPSEVVLRGAPALIQRGDCCRHTTQQLHELAPPHLLPSAEGLTLPQRSRGQAHCASQQNLGDEVADGSICEILTVSISLPIFPRKRTLRGHLGTSEPCQTADTIRLASTGRWCASLWHRPRRSSPQNSSPRATKVGAPKMLNCLAVRVLSS